MTTDTIELTEIQQDVDDAEKCSFTDCDIQPLWVLKCRSCKTVGGLFCDAHRVELSIYFEAERKFFGGTIECTECHSEGVWSDVSEFVPL